MTVSPKDRFRYQIQLVKCGERQNAVHGPHSIKITVVRFDIPAASRFATSKASMPFFLSW